MVGHIAIRTPPECQLLSLLTTPLSVWYGVQASIGGDCMKVMLRSIWPGVNNIRQF
jgi:hypothetical protein